MAELSWGRRYLMCAPEHFGVLYEINPWMHTDVAVERDGAKEQWDFLTKTLRDAGAELEFMPAQPEWPDIVFTANAGIVNGGQFVPARFRFPERQGEMPHNIAWFESQGWRVNELPDDVCHEGAGDALPFNDVLVSGYRFRTDAASHAYLSELTGAPVHSVELVDPRLYHLDLTLCPLDERRAIVAPMGWSDTGKTVMEQLIPEPLVLEQDEALAFCANSVVVGKNIVMPSCPPRVGRQLEQWGFTVAVAPMDEFLKAGGGCRCLTLALDVTLNGEVGSVSPRVAKP